MANPQRGEVPIIVDGTPRVMRLTLGALAELEERLEARSLLALAERFEAGSVPTADLIALLAAGLRGGGDEMTEQDLAGARIDGGAVAAMKAAMLLMSRTFQPEEAETE